MGNTESVASIRRLAKGSACTGRLPEGCVLCARGAKLVLLVTGRCGRRCYYCPLSSEKKGRNVFFANERRVSRMAEMIEEAELMDALGTGITGGDPLMETRRTVAAIRELKRAFGPSHHIHLYTSTTDPRRIKSVAGAGLDEIRFHPPMGVWRMMQGSDFADAVRLCRRLGMSTGIEIPVIPGRESDTVHVISFADSAGLDFVNLNELEFSETNWRALRARGFEPMDDVSSGVRGSERLALDLLRLDADVPLHYCSAAFKDGIQLRRRIMRRARNVRKPHELLTRDGTLVKGVVETRRPARLADELVRDYDVPRRLAWVDDEKGRLELAPWILEKIADELPFTSSIVEEYPTADRLEVERVPLRRR
jgi:hypothetical protein